MRRTLASAAVCCIGLVACSGPAGSPQPRNGGTLQVALPAAPVSLNPLVARDDASELAYAPLYPLLYAAQPDLSVGPELAAALPQYGAGGTTLTVPLRADALWSDGAPISADDVVYTVRTEMDRALPGSAAYDWTDVRSVTRVDAHTVRFTLRAPDARFLADQLVTPIVPSHVLASVPPAQMATAAFSRAPTVSGGPFTFRGRTATALSFDANPRFLLGRPHADHLVEHIDQAMAALPGDLGSGAVSWAPDLDALSAAQAIISSGVAVQSYADTSVVALQFNVRDGHPFATAATRRALALTLDHDAIVAGATGVSQDYPVWSDINQASWAFTAPAHVAQDIGAARRALAGTRPAGTIVFPRSDGQRAAAAALVARDAQQAGFMLTPVALGDADFATALARGAFDVAVVTVPQQLDPDDSALLRTGAPLNTGGYANPALDALFGREIAAVPGTTSLDQVRAPLLAAIQRTVSSDLPIYPLWAPRHYMGFSALLGGVSAAGAQLDAARSNSFYDDWFLTG